MRRIMAGKYGNPASDDRLMTGILFAVAELWWEEVMFNGRCTEPSLEELFGDAAMRRDGVTESDIRVLLCALKDARAVALGATRRRPGAIKSGAHMPDRRETVVSSRAARSLEAGKTPFRFI
jgi:hypothetical protein